MKNIYRTLMALAATLLLAPAAFAQYEGHEKYIEYPSKSVGLNKYLVSNEPNGDGEYTLRLETFTTGSVSKHVLPTDFVLVMDNSGSMLEDCLFGKLRPDYVTAAQMADPNDQYYQFLRPAHAPGNAYLNRHCYSYSGGYSGGNLGDAMSTRPANTYHHSGWSYFDSTESSPSSSLYYYYAEDATYYKIKREEVPDGPNTDNAHYFLYFDRKDNLGRKYIRSTSATDISVTDARPAANNNNRYKSQILLIGFDGDGIYRPETRLEELVPAYKSFIQEIADHNSTDNFAPGVTVKHQVAVVSFSQAIASGTVQNPDLTPAPNSLTYTEKHQTRVIKDFAEIGSGNVNTYKNVLDNYFSYRMGTQTFYGMRLATRLLQKLERNNPSLAPINSSGHVVRNKVVILFTDGEPKEVLANGNFPTDAQVQNGTASKFYTVQYCLQEADIIQAERTSLSGTEINGKVFCLDFAGSEGAARFLQYTSSNYSNCAATLTGPINEEKDEDGNLIYPPIMDRISYTGTANADQIYYKYANTAGGLTDAFQEIADANTAYSSSSHLVAVDLISDNFDLPAGLTADSEKIKIYTAQCIGTKQIDGQTYLAFAQPVQANSRPALAEIWFADGVDDDNNTIWVKQENLDIDNGLSCFIDGKKLVFRGFDFANLWCGKDDTPGHNNTQQVSPGDPNASYQDPEYRGFKLIAEFPIVVAENAVGGLDVPTNVYESSGFFGADENGVPEGDAIVNYPKPALTIPIRLIIQKTGLAQGESASFTIERRLIDPSTSTWEEFTTFFLTGNGSDTNPEIRFLSLDPSYYYRVKESGWSWAYENAGASYMPSTETQDPRLGNPIVFENTPKTTVPRRAEAKAVNKMSAGSTDSSTVYDETK